MLATPIRHALWTAVAVLLLAIGLVACGDGGTAVTTTATEASRGHVDGSTEYIVKGGDNSVQEYGREADAAERNAAATALHNFLDARAAGDWAAACDQLARSVTDWLVKAAAQAERVEGASCAGILEKLTNPAAKSAMKEEAAQANVGSLRVEEERAFAIYRASDMTILATPMVHEGGEWKVASLDGVPLN